MDGFAVLDADLRRSRLMAPDGPVDAVIDTDVTNEIDDQFAIVWAALAPERIRLRGLHACPYSLSPELVRGGGLVAELDRRRLEATLDKLGVGVDDTPRTTPAEGMARARAELDSLCELLDLEPALVAEGAEHYLGEDPRPVTSEATEHLIELARSGSEPLYVLAIGAATNIAAALLADPGLCERIVVVWTSAHPSFWPYANASYNLAQDREAARVVLDSGVPLVYLPGYYVGEKLRVTRPEVVELIADRGPVADYLFDLYDRHPLTGDHHAHSKALWDLVCVAWLIDPAWLHTHLTPTPHLDDDLRWRADPDRPLMCEALDVDRDAVFADLSARLDGL